jgi:hypothetical protein
VRKTLLHNKLTLDVRIQARQKVDKPTPAICPPAICPQSFDLMTISSAGKSGVSGETVHFLLISESVSNQLIFNFEPIHLGRGVRSLVNRQKLLSSRLS